MTCENIGQLCLTLTFPSTCTQAFTITDSLFIMLVYLCISVAVFESQHSWSNPGSEFSPAAMWVQETELIHSGCAGSSFTC